LCYKKEEEESFCAPLKAAENFLFLFFIGLSAGFYASLKVLKLSSSSFYPIC